MKKIVLFGLIFTLFSCEDNKVAIARQAVLDSGVRVNKLMFDICFGDSPETVKTKLLESGHVDRYGKFEYQFPSPLMQNLKWRDSPVFHNDSLVSFGLVASCNPYAYPLLVENAYEVLNYLYSIDYGTPIHSKDKYGKHLYWFKGNLEILVYASKYVISINFENHYKVTNRFAQKNIYDDNRNTYTEEYWNIHYKNTEEGFRRKKSD